MTGPMEVGEPVHADELAFIVDTDDYFEAVKDALTRAQRSVLILGWEVDSDVRLGRADSGDEDPPTLSELLSGLLGDRPELEIHVLCWDWSMIYALERELWPRKKMGSDSRERLHFELDGQHPAGASHHEKVVVIDDDVAFIGGIDLARRRWDTRAHDPEDPRLKTPADESYRPYHDVQAVVSGPAAQALGERARSRWRRATGEDIDSPGQVDDAAWPHQVEPLLRDVPLRLVRTGPAEQLYETEAWYVKACERAEDLIYLENQYLTSRKIGQVLQEVLERSCPPEIAIVTSKQSEGWLEQASMDALRSRVVGDLRSADPGGRLAVWWPDTGHGDSPTVHTKLAVIDDRMAYLGSANLSNRSMGLDTECGLVMDAQEDPRLEDVIAHLRRSLLAEHLGTTPEEVARAEKTEGGVIAAVEGLRGGNRTLRNLEISMHPLTAVADQVSGVFDPEKPARLTELESWLPWKAGDADSTE